MADQAVTGTQELQRRVTLDDVASAQTDVVYATDRLRRYVREAVAAGLPIRQVAIHAQVNRQTVYNWLAEE